VRTSIARRSSFARSSSSISALTDRCRRTWRLCRIIPRKAS
jgi:hypothetical protein